jgi:hypothetical protein
VCRWHGENAKVRARREARIVAAEAAMQTRTLTACDPITALRDAARDADLVVQGSSRRCNPNRPDGRPRGARLQVGDSESGAFWMLFLRGLRPTAHGVQLATSGPHTGAE